MSGQHYTCLHNSIVLDVVRMGRNHIQLHGKSILGTQDNNWHTSQIPVNTQNIKTSH